MKYYRLLVVVFVTLASFSLYSCSKCSDDDPEAKILNNTTKEIVVDITPGGGSQTVKSLRRTSYSSYSPGTVQITVTVNGSQYHATATLEKCYQYQFVFWGSSISVNGKNVDDNGSSGGSSGHSWDND